MKRVLTELTKECELTVQMYISGLEKDEIANLKCRAFSTINNQLQTAYKIMKVKNGRELCRKFYERLSGVEFTFDFSPVMQTAVACCLLLILVLDSHFEMRRQRIRTRSNVNVEIIARSRTRVRGRDIPLVV